MDGDSSLCGFGPGPPPPPQRTRARGHLSANAAWEAEAGLEFLKKALVPFFVPYGFSGISTLAGHPHSAGGQVCFPEPGVGGQDVGLGDKS